MQPWLIFLVGMAYLGILFTLATFAERKKRQGSSVINHPLIYTLSLGVYCTAWTYYGSVGRAATNGIEFITIYLGPTIMAGLFWPVLRKMLRISRMLRLTSIADFISTRYGKNFSIAVMVTIFSVLGLIPYIALQIKSILSGFDILAGNTPSHSLEGNWLLTTSLVIILMLFTILYGARTVDAGEKHEGLISAIAFESLVKLVAFIMVGLFVTYGLFNGFGDIFKQAYALPNGPALFTLQQPAGFAGWTALLVISGLAFLLLPRQFQVGVVENLQEKHINTATWSFPLYLLLINLFVLPVAFAGLLLLDKGINADQYVLAFPVAHGKTALALITWLGGLSAATGMIIVETIALSIMISNNLVMPILLKSLHWKWVGEQSLSGRVLWIRRLSIALVLLLALFFSQTTTEQQSLVSIGLISFCAVSQFGPSVIGGMFWKQGNRAGAIAGLLAGFAIWGYTLILPGWWPDASWVTNGPFQIALLKPSQFLGIEGWNQITVTTWWSLLANTVLYIFVSLNTKAPAQEKYQAELFVDVYLNQAASAEGAAWKGTAKMTEIVRLMENFLGKERANALINGYVNRHKLEPGIQFQADGKMVAFAERMLGGVVGTASARTLISSITKEEEINIEEVLNILKENRQMYEMNRQLRKKQQELSRATHQLEKVNEQLRLIDQQKNEFLYTVTHELRTPLTSIRALSEILHDNSDLEEEQRQQYLEAITRETERLSYLISQVLTLEKYESGRHRLNVSALNLETIVKTVVENMRPVAAGRQVAIRLKLTGSQPLIQGDGELITQVVYNLLGNAIKFARTEIVVSLVSELNEWQLHVRDDGRGIEPELHTLIFDKFFQARNQTLKKPEGSGLGLAICKKIVDLHGGTIRVDSTPGIGSNFIVAFPV
jgi:Na+/proline symporter/signal transduction histidine kinase